MRRLMTIFAAFATLTTGAVVTTVAAPEASAQSWRGGDRHDWRRDDRRRWNRQQYRRGSPQWRRDRLRAERRWRNERRWRAERAWRGQPRYNSPYAYGGRPCHYVRRGGRTVCV